MSPGTLLCQGKEPLLTIEMSFGQMSCQDKSFLQIIMLLSTLDATYHKLFQKVMSIMYQFNAKTLNMNTFLSKGRFCTALINPTLNNKPDTWELNKARAPKHTKIYENQILRIGKSNMVT